MQFLLTVTIREYTDLPPTELQTSMTQFVEERLRTGTFVITGSFALDGDARRLGSSTAAVVRTEPGPPIHGFGVVEARSLEHAAETAEHLLRIHEQFVPAWRIECELRHIVTHCLP